VQSLHHRLLRYLPRSRWSNVHVRLMDWYEFAHGHDSCRLRTFRDTLTTSFLSIRFAPYRRIGETALGSHSIMSRGVSLSASLLGLSQSHSIFPRLTLFGVRRLVKQTPSFCISRTTWKIERPFFFAGFGSVIFVGFVDSFTSVCCFTPSRSTFLPAFPIVFLHVTLQISDLPRHSLYPQL